MAIALGSADDPGVLSGRGYATIAIIDAGRRWGAQGDAH
jgi:hypothetical protein